MKKLIIHIGYPKTATTSLQLNLFADLHKLGRIEYLNHLNNNDNGYLGTYYIRNILNKLVTEKKISEDRIKEELSALNQIKKEISVVSAETLSVWYPGFTFSHFDSSAKANAQKLNDTFSKYFDSIEVVIGIRAHETLIRSIFKQWYQYISSEHSVIPSLENWLNNNFIYPENKDLIAFNYNTLVSSYMEVFGPQKTHVLIYEDLIFNKKYYFQEISRIFNIDIKVVEASLEKKIHNVSKKSPKGLETDRPTLGQMLTRPFRHFLKKYFGSNVFKFTKRLYRKVIPSTIRAWKVGKRKTVRPFTDKEIKSIETIFTQSNLDLIVKLRLDQRKMKNYKYI